MSDLTIISAENQKELLKLIAPAVKQATIHRDVEDFDSETDNTHPASTSTPVKSKATTSNNTPISPRNRIGQKLFRVKEADLSSHRRHTLLSIIFHRLSVYRDLYEAGPRND